MFIRNVVLCTIMPLTCRQCEPIYHPTLQPMHFKTPSFLTRQSVSLKKTFTKNYICWDLNQIYILNWSSSSVAVACLVMPFFCNCIANRTLMYCLTVPLHPPPPHRPITLVTTFICGLGTGASCFKSCKL
jgi:hypothetical protein